MWIKKVKPNQVMSDDKMLQEMVADCYNKDIRWIGTYDPQGQVNFEIILCEKDRIKDKEFTKFLKSKNEIFNG